MENADDLADVFGPMVYRLADAPEPIRDLFFYIMAWLLVSDEQARLVSVGQNEKGITFLFQTRRGQLFSVRKPELTEAEEQVLYSEVLAPQPMGIPMPPRG